MYMNVHINFLYDPESTEMLLLFHLHRCVFQRALPWALLGEVSNHPDLSQELLQLQDTADLDVGLLLPVMHRYGI
jgi:hypothetical protein